MSQPIVHAASGEKFPAPEEYVGYALHDPPGEKIGSVETVFVNGGGDPEYVRARIKTGFLKSKTVLIPVSFAEVDDQRRTLTLK